MEPNLNPDPEPEPRPELKVWVDHHEAEVKNPYLYDRWPMSPQMREAIMAKAFQQCGLDQVGQPLKHPDGTCVRLKSRDKVAAMRIVVQLEKNSLEEQRLCLQDRYALPESSKPMDDMYALLTKDPQAAKASAVIYRKYVPEVKTDEDRAKQVARGHARRIENDRWPIPSVARKHYFDAAGALRNQR